MIPTIDFEVQGISSICYCNLGKKKIQSKVIIVIGAVATIIGFFYGMLVSLIFVAALTTRENGKRTDEAEIDI